MGEPEGLNVLQTFDFGSIEEMDPSVGRWICAWAAMQNTLLPATMSSSFVIACGSFEGSQVNPFTNDAAAIAQS